MAFRLGLGRREFNVESFKFVVYLTVPIGVAIYYSTPEHWIESLTSHEPVETPEEAQRRQAIEELSLKFAKRDS